MHGEMGCAYKTVVGKRRELYYMESISVDRRVVLNYVYKK